MAYEILLRLIDERLRAKGLSERKACMMADVGVNTIRHIRVRNHAPKPESLAALAPVLGVPALYLLEAAAAVASGAPSRLSSIFVRGTVQAGVWRDAVEWEPDEWYPVFVTEDLRFPPEATRFGLLVRGSSMDRLYPEGTIVVAVRFADIGRGPKSGERVVVYHRAAGGQTEATLKEYEVDASGRHILWPRSTSPEFQQPIVLDGPGVPVEGDLESGDPDLVISALIIGSYRPE